LKLPVAGRDGGERAVAPRAGAWIETRHSPTNRAISGRAPRGRVD